MNLDNYAKIKETYKISGKSSPKGEDGWRAYASSNQITRLNHEAKEDKIHHLPW